MALQLPDDGFIGHITWASRGHGPFDAEELEAAGFTPVTAPGALEGIRYSKVFRRKADGYWAVKGVNTEEGGLSGDVVYAVKNLGLGISEHRTMFNSLSWSVDFLDGGLHYYAADYGFSGPPTLDLSGNKALRLVCHRLGIVQPRRLRGESEVPSMAALEAELRAEVILVATTKRAGH